MATANRKRPALLSLPTNSPEKRVRYTPWPDAGQRLAWAAKGRYTVTDHDFINTQRPSPCSRHYKVLAQLGHGESSDTYLAHPLEQPHHWVVLKQVSRLTLRPPSTTVVAKAHASSAFKDLAAYQQFILEVELQTLAATAGLSPAVEDYWVCERVGDQVMGVIVSPLLGSPTDRPRMLGDLSEAELTLTLPRVATLVERLHALHIIHHDLRRGNNILIVGLQPYLIDYGLAELKATTLSVEESAEWTTIVHCPLLNTWQQGLTASAWAQLWPASTLVSQLATRSGV